MPQSLPPKILAINPTLAKGGMENNLATFFSLYDQGKFKISFIYFKKLYPDLETSPLEDSLKRINKVYYLPYQRKGSLFKVAKLLRPIIVKERPDLILTKGWFCQITASLACLFLRTKPRIVGVFDNDPEHDFLEILKNERWSFLKQKIYSFLVRKIDQQIAVSRGVAKLASQVYKYPQEKIKTIYNGVNINEIEKKAQKEINHPWFRAKVPILINVGRLSSEKNQADLLRAFAILRRNIKAKLILVGDGQEKENLQNSARKLKIEKDVYFAGWQDNPYAWMKRADVFVLSSFSEGLGMVILEAWALGLPVISTMTVGPKEIIQDKINGLLVQIGDPEKLAEGIKTLLKDESLRKQIAKNARREVEKKFNAEKMVKEYEKLLEDQIVK